MVYYKGKHSPACRLVRQRIYRALRGTKENNYGCTETQDR